MALPFSVGKFGAGSLGKILVAHSHDKNVAVAEKPQVRFLERQLMALSCKTILIEGDYTERNFLEDYAAYYVRCFEPYSRICTRLHFFREALDRDKVSKAILDDDAAALQASYLGFIVVKPLPLTVVGRTCLVAPAAHDGRAFPPTKVQHVDLYGLRLDVETLPFQEQDREVAACASSALWTMLHSTAHQFHHAKPSPVEITKAATAHARVNGRTFPNGDGLNTLQIADAIRSVGLEPSVLTVSSMPRLIMPAEEFASADVRPMALPSADPELAAEMRMVLKLSVLAYLRSGIACVLLARTSDEVNSASLYLPDIEADEPFIATRGNHAVAITGYALCAEPGETHFRESSTRFVAGRLERLFVHDDQTGPFASFAFDEGNRLIAEDYQSPDVIRRFAEPINLVIPLYHKIRIPLRQIVDMTVHLDQSIKALPFDDELADELEWDIQLMSLEALRDDLAQSTLSKDVKLQMLTLALPRYLWRVRALRAGKAAFDLLLDATDLLQGKLVRRLVIYDKGLCNEIALLFALSGKMASESLEAVVAAFKSSFPGDVAAA